VIVERGGVKFGVTSVTAGGYYKFNVGKGVQVSDDFSFLEIEDALKKVVPELRKQADVVVVLDHDGPGDAKRVVESIPGIDVVVVGHNPGYMFNPDRVGETLIIRGGNRGQYLAVTELTLDGAGKVVDYNGEAKPMDEGVAKDATYESLENAFDASYKERENTEKRKTAAEKAMIQGTEKYVGGEMCARCHAEIYDAWAHTPHARAFETLVHEGQEANAECVKCHVVGFGEESGYAIDVQKQDEEGNVLQSTDHPALRNVQCESCHGMGTFHGTVAMEKIPSENTCRTCHSGKYGEGFDYAASIAKGVHR
jgi:hypothetical protein